MKLIWLESARRDLEDIKAWTTNEAGEHASALLLRKIVLSAKLLLDHPYLGKNSSISDEVREWQVAQLPYLLPYRVINQQIEILRVFHESQRLPESWGN
jgi:plasmid stabilization system protein ParE